MIEVPLLIDCLSEYIGESVVSVYRQHPEWFCLKYKNYPWYDKNFKAKFINKLKEQLNHSQNQDELVNQIIKLLPHFFLPPFFISYEFTELLANIRKSTHPALELEARQRETGLSRFKIFDNPFAILLIDAENISLDINLETILAEICQYPIKIKLAFANWRSLGKKDLEFHQKGYEMIHVPQGKNSADLKMITVGASIWGHYPMAKEFIVCSSDGDLNHLSIALQNNGLTVYRVSRKGDQITVFNSQTGKNKTYNLTLSPESFSLSSLGSKLKEIIREEQEKNQNVWVKVGVVSETFVTKYKIPLEMVLAHHFPDKNSAQALQELKQDFVFYEQPDKSQLFVTIFNGKKLDSTVTAESPASQTDLNSVKDLENAVLKIIKFLCVQANQEYVPINSVASEFNKQHASSATKALKNLHISGTFAKFLLNCDKLKTKSENNTQYVGLA